MKRCDPVVRAKCPDGKHCELYAEFLDGSECDKFNEQVLSRPMTNADRIRAMSDDELCDFMMVAGSIPCDGKIAEMMRINSCNDCSGCIMAWLQQREVNDPQ